MTAAPEFYPAIVDTPAGRWAKARTVIEGGEILLFGQDGEGKISLLRRARLTETPDMAVPAGGGPFPSRPPHPEYPARVMTAEGVWTISPEGGCGCGTTLKAISRTVLLKVAAQA